MKFLSVCSGIEAASAAWGPLGWKAVAFSEIEKFPCAVLDHHYPDVPNWGDMTKFKEWPDANVDVLCGGTPCQSFSVAGLRKGLDDPRGDLMLTYCAIADKYRPKWLVWENVPGVLSSNGGKDFGAFLGALAELGYGFAYRVLDAQHFGVPQRRRRVFVVGCLRDSRSAAEVLFESQGLQGNIESRAEDWEAEHTRRVKVRPFDMLGFGQYGRGLTSSTCKARDYKDATDLVVDTDGRVRRLTPVECERLQGFPDGYTKIPWRGKPADQCPDGPRYKALGNSWAVPCARWIGERIEKVEEI
jgi:DNA (cytosine-5)-methyltransferase 1